MSRRWVAWAVLIGGLGTTGSAQGTAGPPIRTLDRIEAFSSITFNEVDRVVGLTDGRVLVHALLPRRVLLLDARLGNPIAVFDTAPGRPNTYPRSIGGLIQAVGDTTLFVDANANIFVTIEPSGALGRALPSPPGLVTMSRLTSSAPPYGTAVVMKQLGLMFVGSSVRVAPPPDVSRAGTIVLVDDSLPLLAMRFDSRTVDTIAKLASANGPTYRYDLAGNATIVQGADRILPVSELAMVDQWAAASDGWIAVLRERDYRVEWYDPTGRRSSSVRLPFAWQRLDDAAKQHIADSINAADKLANDQQNARRDSMRTGLKPNPSGLPTMRISARPPVRVEVLSDFVPPTSRGARTMTGDGDGNVWIRHASRPGDTGIVYDVVSRAGGIIDRVRLPVGKRLLGFGPGGVAYLYALDGGRVVVERVRR